MMTPLPPMMSQQDEDALRGAVSALPEPATLVEYGSGGSTTLFASLLKPQQRLYSIEHNPLWFTKVKAALDGAPHVIQYLAPLSYPMDLWRFARPEEEMGAGAEDYINPTAVLVNWSVVNFVFVDGIARGPVLAALRTRLNPGTPVFLHDYKGREAWYDWAVKLYRVIAMHDLLIELRVP